MEEEDETGTERADSLALDTYSSNVPFVICRTRDTIHFCGSSNLPASARGPQSLVSLSCQFVQTILFASPSSAKLAMGAFQSTSNVQ